LSSFIFWMAKLMKSIQQSAMSDQRSAIGNRQSAIGNKQKRFNNLTIKQFTILLINQLTN
jgi:hypothetical protein